MDIITDTDQISISRVQILKKCRGFMHKYVARPDLNVNCVCGEIHDNIDIYKLEMIVKMSVHFGKFTILSHNQHNIPANVKRFSSRRVGLYPHTFTRTQTNR